jgi:putative ABC transport system permease protein
VRALWRAAAGDLRHRRLQAVMLFAVVAVAAIGITAGLGQQRSAADRWDDALADANAAHVALYGDPAALARIRADPEVVGAEGPAPAATATLARRGEVFDDLEVRAAGAQPPTVGVPLLLEGRWLSGRDPREIVLGRSFALAEGIEPGDRVRLRGARGGSAMTATVVGTALDLVDCFYPECESQMAWAPPATVADLTPPGSDPGAFVLLRLARPDAAEAFTARVQRRAGSGVDDLEHWRDTRDNALALNRFFGGFLAAFGVLLLVAAGIVILSAVSARVLARSREVGVLKAIGFTPRSLTLLVLGENLAIALAGAVAGVAVGGLLAPTLQLRMVDVLERGRATFPAGVLAGAVLVVLVIVGVATLVPALRAGRVPAARAIMRGAAPAGLHPSRLAHLASRLRLGAPVAVGLKDAGARPLRSTLTVAALAVTVVAIVAALAFDRTVAEIADDPALTGAPQGVIVEPRDVSPARVTAALDRHPDVRSWFTATERQATVGDDAFQVRVLSGDVRRTGYVLREGRMPAGPGEAVVGYGLEDRLGIGVGDRLAMGVGGARLDVRVVGGYAEGEDEGRRAMITLSDLRRVEPGADPGAFFARVAPGADREAVARAVQAELPGGRATAEEADVEVFDAFRAAFYVIAVLLLAVALVNLVGTTALGVRERARDLVVLKAVGFTPGQVALGVAVGSGAPAVAAVLVGVPVGLLASAAMLTSVGRDTGLGPQLGAAPAAAAVALAALAVVALAAGVGALVARRAAAAPVAEGLRAE